MITTRRGASRSTSGTARGRMRGRVGRCLLTAGLACIAVLTTPTIGAAQDGSGDAVTIETDLAPLQGGTFEVTEGADALGCSSGTADAGTIEPRGDGLDSITKTLTCDSGPNTGTFTIVFLPDTPPGGDQQQGPWEITAGTGTSRDCRVAATPPWCFPATSRRP